jgi:hypothetical protein
MKGRLALLPGWLVLAACLVALLGALTGPPAAAQPSAATDGGVPAPDAGRAPHPAFTSGRAPMPGDMPVPDAWMPPGSDASPVPSDEIFPQQSLTLRFNHKKHVQELKLFCKVCHATAYKSGQSSDDLLPSPSTCDACHDVDHTDLVHVKAGSEDNGQCGFCHLGAEAGADGRVAPVVIPRPNLRFPHDKHLARNIDCAQCHGQIGELELATRDQLPRMAGCFRCHAQSGAAQGEAKGACTTCHLTERRGTLLTTFASGELVPPRWLHNAAHTPDWIERHKTVAADNSAFCASCHSADQCTDCHDGRVRPRNVHPNDWISMHAQAARQDNPRCVSCHQEQTFCADCHRRVGVARDAPSGNRLAGRRFHPPPSEWTTGPRSPQHHAWEAQRNLNACVSCHTERDCATCHATRGVSGGQGVNPHPLGFEAKCESAFRRNPRPCLVCHEPGDAFLRSCQ